MSSALKDIQTALSQELRSLNEIIRISLSTDNEMMNHIVTSYLATKGKQIRPILVILAASMFGSVNKHVLYAAASLEMLHNASLIHDDVVDNSPERRGTKTINAVWDNHIAVLVGDFFVSKALAVGVMTESLHAVQTLSQLGEELALGEIDQICNAREAVLDEQKYMSVIAQKTASLFTDCVVLGAELAGATPQQVHPMAQYARLLGLCFQIKDDTFDYYKSDKVGKPTGNDLREGKITLPLLYALTHTTGTEADNMRALVKKGTPLTDPEIAILVEFAKKEGGVDYAYRRMEELQQQADSIILKYPDNEARCRFREIFSYIISRDS